MTQDLIFLTNMALFRFLELKFKTFESVKNCIYVPGALFSVYVFLVRYEHYSPIPCKRNTLFLLFLPCNLRTISFH